MSAQPAAAASATSSSIRAQYASGWARKVEFSWFGQKGSAAKRTKASERGGAHARAMLALAKLRLPSAQPA